MGQIGIDDSVTREDLAKECRAWAEENQELREENARLRRESAEAFAAYIQQHEGMVESPVRMDGQEGTGLQSAFMALENYRAALAASEGEEKP